MRDLTRLISREIQLSPIRRHGSLAEERYASANTFHRDFHLSFSIYSYQCKVPNLLNIPIPPLLLSLLDRSSIHHDYSPILPLFEFLLSCYRSCYPHRPVV